MYRRDIATKAREADKFLFGGHFLMGDTNMWYQIACYGKIKFIQDVTAVYRRNEGSCSRFKEAKSSYRFILSSMEMRLYLAKRDYLGEDIIRKFENLYDNALINYRCFDKNYNNALYPLNRKTSYFKKLLITFGIMRKILQLKFILRQRAATLYRRCFNPTYTFG